MVAHDVSAELRGEHGKWTKGGAAIKRLAGEAEKTAAARPAQGDRVKYHTGSLGTVHHVDEKGRIHVVWDKGRGKPVATPAHHLTPAEGEKKQAAEKAVRKVVKPDDVPVRQPSGPTAPSEIRTFAPGELRNTTRDHLNRLHELYSKPAPPGSDEAYNRRLAGARYLVNRELDRRGGNKPYSPPRQAGSRGGVPAPTTGPQIREGSFEQVHKEYLDARKRVLTSNVVGGNPTARRQMDVAETKLREMGARRSSTKHGEYEMPPKPGTAEHSAEQLKRELASINEQLHSQHEEAGTPLYTPEQLAETRRSDMAAQVRAGQDTVVVKVPSGSEIQMSQATARYLLYGEQPGASFERGTAAEALARSQKISATERKGLSNILGIPESQITLANIQQLRTRARAKMSNLRRT